MKLSIIICTLASACAFTPMKPTTLSSFSKLQESAENNKEPVPANVESDTAAEAEPEPVVVAAPEPVVVATPEPVVVATPEPVVVATPEPVVVATPEPVVVATPEPVVVATPEPVVVATPEPVVVATPEPVVVATPEPVVVATPEPVVVATPEPVVVATPEPVVVATPEPVVVATPEPVVVATPEPVVVATPEPVVVATPEPVVVATPEPVVAAAAVATNVGSTGSAATATLFTKADLLLLAEKANPTIRYYDPLKLADGNFWGEGNEATIGWLRHAEIKHGRVAMAAFVGYWVQSNYVFPWPQTLAGDLHPSVDLSPEAQWDATPLNARLQIILVLGALEVWDECGGGIMPHYMNGRRPGTYPSFQLFRDTIHFVFDLYDPFNIWKNKMSEEKKERRLVMEINNGRLAMLGIFGFLAADVVPGSVPALTGIAQPYDGNIMAPFESSFSFLVQQ